MNSGGMRSRGTADRGEQHVMTHRQLGDLTISRLLEMNSPDFEPYGFFPETTPADWEPHLHWMQPRAMDPVSGNLYFPMQS